MTGPNRGPSYDVFLSHNRRQKAWVRGIVSFLREKGLRVFFDEDSIQPGEDIVVALERAIEASQSLVLVLSRSSVFSKWVAFETTINLYEDPQSSLRRLIPILVEPVDRTLIRPAVRRLDAVDLTDPRTREAEFLHFLRSLGLDNIPARELPPWPESSGVEDLRIADLNTVSDWNWTGERLLEHLIRLDYQLFSGLTPEQEGQVDQWSPVFIDHPDTWRLLVTPANDIVGYWHFVPLFPEDFTRAISGQLTDSEITTDRVRVFEFPGRYSVYFVSFGLLPRFRGTKAYKLLLDSMFDVFLELAHNGIFVDHICANAFTASGDAMCKTFGLECVRPHQTHGRIYAGSMVQVLDLDICKGYADLSRLYRAVGTFPGHDKEV